MQKRKYSVLSVFDKISNKKLYRQALSEIVSSCQTAIGH